MSESPDLPPSEKGEDERSEAALATPNMEREQCARSKNARNWLTRPHGQFSLRGALLTTSVACFLAMAARMAGGASVLDFSAWFMPIFCVLGLVWLVNRYLKIPSVFIGGISTTCALAFITCLPHHLTQTTSFRRIYDAQSPESYRASWLRLRLDSFLDQSLDWLVFFGIAAFWGMLGGLVIGLLIRFIAPRLAGSRVRLLRREVQTAQFDAAALNASLDTPEMQGVPSPTVMPGDQIDSNDSRTPPELQTSPSEGSRWEHARASLLRPSAQFSMRTLFAIMTVSGFFAMAARVAGGQTAVGVGAWLSALLIVLGLLWVFEYLVRTPLVFVCGVGATCAVAILTSASFFLDESFDRYSLILDREASLQSASDSWERIRPATFFMPLLGWLTRFGLFALLGMLGGAVIMLWIKVILPRSPWKRRRAAFQSEPSPTFTAQSKPSPPAAPSPTDNTL